MLLSIFIFLVLFSLIFIIGGYYIEAPVAQIAGTAVLFVTGLLLMFSTVEYSSGETTYEIYQYGNNFTGYHWDYDTGTAPSGPQVDEYLFHRNITTNTTYSTWDEEIVQGIKSRHTVAVLILITAILVFVSILSQLREGIDDER